MKEVHCLNFKLIQLIQPKFKGVFSLITFYYCSFIKVSRKGEKEIQYQMGENCRQALLASLLGLGDHIS